MANSTLATARYPAHTNNYWGDRQGKKVDKIIIHHMAAPWTAKRCCESFQDASRGASANYCIGKDGEIAVSVDEVYASGCSSNKNADMTGITIEVANSEMGGQWPVSDKALTSLIKLCADIAKRHGLGTLVKGKNLCWHQMYAATACPGPYLLSKMDFICNSVNNANAPAKPATPAATSEMYRVRKSWADAASQIGAYSILENAKNACKEGYTVFNSAGQAVYSKAAPAPAPAAEMYRVRKSWADAASQIGAYTVLSNAKAACKAGYSVFNSKGQAVYSVAAPAPAPAPKPTPKPAAPSIVKGSRVRVKQGAPDYNGGGLASFVYNTVYTVLESPVGDRVVIGINGQVTAAVKKSNLYLA